MRWSTVRPIALAATSYAIPLTCTANGQQLAWQFDPPTFFANTQNIGTTGIVFRVTEELTITRLGFYDDDNFSPDGLGRQQQVGIYLDSNQQLLTSGTVPAGTAAPLVGRFRMVDVDDITLQPSTDYVLASTLIDDGFILSQVGDEITLDPRVILVEERGGGGTTLSYPPSFQGTITFDVGPIFEIGDASQADAPAWNVPSANSSSPASTNVFGTRFTPNEDISVSALGYYDETLFGDDGLEAAHEVGIYDDQTFQLLASATVPAGTQAARNGSHRYVSITPIMLEAGRSYSCVATIAGDRTSNVTPGGSLVVDPRITTTAWVGDFGSASLRFPFDGVVTTNTRIMGPSFIIGDGSGDPEPCPADVNADGVLNSSDFFAWVTFFVADPRTPQQEAACDVNRSGVCDNSDFFAWVTIFTGEGCPE